MTLFEQEKIDEERLIGSLEKLNKAFKRKDTAEFAYSIADFYKDNLSKDNISLNLLDVLSNSFTNSYTSQNSPIKHHHSNKQNKENINYTNFKNNLIKTEKNKVLMNNKEKEHIEKSINNC